VTESGTLDDAARAMADDAMATDWPLTTTLDVPASSTVLPESEVEVPASLPG
jgi:hypothetical protein